MWSLDPLSAAATSLESSIWRRISEALPAAPPARRPTRRPSARPPAFSIATRMTLAHVLGRGGAGLGHRVAHDLAQLGVRQLGGEVGLDQLRLRLLGVGEVVATRVAEGAGRLVAALALAAQHGQLVVLAVLGGLLQLGEDEAQDPDAIPLPRLHRGGEVMLHRVGQRHPPR